MVLGFFVMSGFLLGLYFDKAENFDVRGFFVKKAKRLLPMFFATLGMGVVGIFAKNAVAPEMFPLLPCSNIHDWTHCLLTKVVSHYNTPLWFMVVEISFLVCAPLFYVLYRTGRGVGLCSLLAVCLLTSIFLFMQVPAESLAFAGDLYYRPLYRAWQFIAGLAAAQVFCFLSRKKKFTLFLWRKQITIVFFIVFVCISVYLMQAKQGGDLAYVNYDIRFDMASVGFFAILIPMLYSLRVDCSARVASIITYAAMLTYPMYLIHDLVYAARRLPDIFLGVSLPNWICAVSAFGISLIASAVLLHVQKKAIG